MANVPDQACVNVSTFLPLSGPSGDTVVVDGSDFILRFQSISSASALSAGAGRLSSHFVGDTWADGPGNFTFLSPMVVVLK